MPPPPGNPLAALSAASGARKAARAARAVPPRSLPSPSLRALGLGCLVACIFWSLVSLVAIWRAFRIVDLFLNDMLGDGGGTTLLLAIANMALNVTFVTLLYLSYTDYLANRNGWKVKVPIYLGLFCGNIAIGVFLIATMDTLPEMGAPWKSLLLMILSGSVGFAGYFAVLRAAPLAVGQHPPKSPLPLVGALAGALHVALYIGALVALVPW